MTTSSRLSFGICLLALSAAAAAQNAFTTQPTDVYAGPDDNYPPVAQLDADAPVQVMGCLDDWSWCDVAFGDDRGWVYAPDVIYQYQDGFVPLYTYAPTLGVPIVVFTLGDYWGRYYHERPWYGQREEWEHREHRHHRPPGPPPSVSPPPLSARVERPHGPGQEHERPFRLGKAGPPNGRAEPAERPEAPNRETERPPADQARPQPPGERPPRRADHPSREEDRPREENPPHEQSSPRRTEPSPREEQAPHEQPQSGRAGPPKHEERPPARSEAPREEHPAQSNTRREERRPIKQEDHPQEPPH